MVNVQYSSIISYFIRCTNGPSFPNEKFENLLGGIRDSKTCLSFPGVEKKQNQNTKHAKNSSLTCKTLETLPKVSNWIIFDNLSIETVHHVIRFMTCNSKSKQYNLVSRTKSQTFTQFQTRIIYPWALLIIYDGLK